MSFGRPRRRSVGFPIAPSVPVWVTAFALEHSSRAAAADGPLSRIPITSTIPIRGGVLPTQSLSGYLFGRACPSRPTGQRADARDARDARSQSLAKQPPRLHVHWRLVLGACRTIPALAGGASLRLARFADAGRSKFGASTTLGAHGCKSPRALERSRRGARLCDFERNLTVGVEPVHQ